MPFSQEEVRSRLSELAKVAYADIAQTSDTLNTILQIEAEGLILLVPQTFLKEVVNIHLKFLVQLSRYPSRSILAIPHFRFSPPIHELPGQELGFWSVWKSSISLLIRYRALALDELSNILVGASLSDDKSLCCELCTYFLTLTSKPSGRLKFTSIQDPIKLSDNLVSTAICSRSKLIFGDIYDIVQKVRPECRLSVDLADRKIHEQLESRLRVGRLIYLHADVNVQQIYYQLLGGQISQSWVDALQNVSSAANHLIFPKIVGTLSQIHESQSGPFASLQVAKAFEDYSIKTSGAPFSEESVTIILLPGTGQLKASFLADPCYGLTSRDGSLWISTYQGRLFSLTNSTLEAHCIQTASATMTSHSLCEHQDLLYSANFRNESISRIDLKRNTVQVLALPTGMLPISIARLGDTVAVIDYLSGAIIEVSRETPRELISLVDHKSDIFFHSICSHLNEICILSKGPTGQALHLYRGSAYSRINIEFTGQYDWFNVSYLGPDKLLLADYNSGVFSYCVSTNVLSPLFCVPDCVNALFRHPFIYAVSESVNALYVFDAHHLCS